MYTSRCVTAVLLSALAISANAKSENLGVIDSVGKDFGNVFFCETPNFTDYYTFSIASPGSVSGNIFDTSYILFFTKDVNLKSLTLTSAGSSIAIAQDTSPNTFSFSGLSSGSYTLAVNGSVGGGLGILGLYSGSIKAVASPAPEASDLMMTALGLGGVAWLVRRKKTAK